MAGTWPVELAHRAYLSLPVGTYEILMAISRAITKPRVTRPDYAGPMETPTAPEATDRLGNKLPASPNAEQIEKHADRLRVVPDADLPGEALDRISEDELERRRSEALTK